MTKPPSSLLNQQNLHVLGVCDVMQVTKEKDKKTNNEHNRENQRLSNTRPKVLLESMPVLLPLFTK
jgi:hypothetical protein